MRLYFLYFHPFSLGFFFIYRDVTLDRSLKDSLDNYKPYFRGSIF